MRYDKPEREHIHKDQGKSTKDAYFDFYREKAEALCGVSFEALELRPKLDKIVKTVPRIVEIVHNEELTEDGFSIRWGSVHRGKDVRDGKNYSASDKHGGTIKTQERESLKWIPAQSKDRISRPVSTFVDGKAGSVRFDAYCHEAELSYVLEHFT